MYPEVETICNIYKSYKNDNTKINKVKFMSLIDKLNKEQQILILSLIRYHHIITSSNTMTTPYKMKYDKGLRFEISNIPSSLLCILYKFCESLSH